jgi:hypothetical protein
LTAELDKAKQATNESMNTSSHLRRIQQLENELSQVKQSLMEENEMKGEINQVNIINNYKFFEFIIIIFFSH